MLGRLLAFVALAASFVPASFAQIGFDGGSTHDGGANASYSWSHTVASTSDPILCVGFSIVDANQAAFVSSVTWNGVGLSKVLSQPAANAFNPVSGPGNFNPPNRTEWWCILAPAPGTHTIAVTLAAAPSIESVAGAISLSRVFQSLTVDATHTSFGVAGAGSGPPQPGSSVTTSAALDWVLDTVLNTGTTNPQATAPSTRQWSLGASIQGAGSSQAPSKAGSVTMNWTGMTNAWSQSVIALKWDGTIAPPTTYYISPTGNDTNNGTSLGTPWLTPNHSVNCGDVIQAAASTSYAEANFRINNWGPVTCINGNNVAWLKCVTFDACKITITTAGNDAMTPSQSYWGVQGWEVKATTFATNQCFNTFPPNNATQIHHIIFANDIANGCGDGAFTVGSSAPVGVDYVAIIGNIAYNAAQDNANCYSGIDMVFPVNSDTLPGTHIYIAGNFSWHNVDPNPCSGGLPTDGQGISLDSLQNGGPYTGQVLVDNNISIFNGGTGVQSFLSQVAPVYIRHNTTYGNHTGSPNSNPCSEINLFQSFPAQVSQNLVETVTANTCFTGSIHPPSYALGSSVDAASDIFSANFLYSPAGNNTTGTNAVFMNNQTGTDPVFANPVEPSAPNCGSFTSVPACMSSVVTNFTPTTTAAKPYGYQIPSAPIYDPLFPQWLCGVTNLPAGLVTMGCLQQAGAFAGQGTIQGQGQIDVGPPATPPTVTISPSVANLATSATQVFTATITNDTFNQGVTWTLSGAGCSGATCGTLSQPISKTGVPITYTAPASAPTPNLVVLTATSILNPIPASSASVNITITASPPPIAVRNQCLPGSQVTAAKNTFSCAATLGNAVEVTVYDSTGTTVTGVTAGGIALTQVCAGATCVANSGGIQIQKWFGIGLPAGITTYVVSNSPATSLMGIAVMDISNITAFDTAAFVGSVTVPTTGPVGPTVTTTSADIIIPAIGVTGGTTGIAAPFTNVPGVVFGNGLAYAISATPGTFTPNWTTTSGTWAGVTSSYIGGVPTPVISVSVAPTTASVKVNTTATFTPTVNNDSQGVNWTLTGAGCSGATCGTLSSSTSASGVAVTYTAPASVPSPATVTLTAASITNPAKTASATITVTSNPIVVSVSPGTANVQTSTTQTFSCTVTNDAANAGCDWTLTGGGCSGATCGTLSVSHTASGVNLTYTGPGSVPSPATVTLTAASTTDNTKTAAATITVVAAPVLTVTVAPGTATVPVNGTQAFTPTVTNDGSNLGVDWTLTGSCTAFSENFSGGSLPAGWTATNATGVEGGGSFSPSHISFSQGVLQMNVTQDGTTAGSVGAEIEYNRAFGYGTYSWSMQAAGTSATQGGAGSAVSGQISSTFQYASGTNPVTTEIDAPEIEGQFPNQIEYTTWVNGSVADSHQVTLSNPQNTYHVYKYIWAPGKIQFFIDGTSQFTSTTNVPTAPAFPITNLWGTNSASFGGVATPGVTRYMYVNNFTYSNCGTLSATHTASGVPVTYTAPAIVPSPATVTITATSTTDNTKSASSTITVGTPPNITVAVAPTSASVTTNGVQNVTATVTNDTSNLGVTWSLSGAGCSGATCGTISPTTSASGVAVTYTAPNSVPSPATVTITATSVTAPSKTATATITVTSPVITVTVAPTTATLQVGGQTQAFTATVANSGSGVNWTLTGSTCTGATCGTLSATTSASGVPITYTSPSSPNVSQTVTLTATSIADGTKTASATIHVNANTTQPSCANTPCPAFLGTGVNGNGSAQGGGAQAIGGRGGVVYEVTTLADSPGACSATAVGFTNCSYRQAYNGPTPRYVIFRVAGTFPVTAGDLRTFNPFMTVEGHSAPGEVIIGGPATTGALAGISTHDVILRYLTYSPDNITQQTGPNFGTTSVWIINCSNIFGPVNNSPPPPSNVGCYNIVTDHVTTRWSGNKSWITGSNFTPQAAAGFAQYSNCVGGNSACGVGPNHNITTQWNLMYEPSQGHPVGYGTATAENCVSSAAAGNCLSSYEFNIDFHHDMLVNVDHRIPENSNLSTRWVNMIVYNWSTYANQWLGAETIDVINSKFIQGQLNSGAPGPGGCGGFGCSGPAQPHPIHFTQNSPELCGNPSGYLAGNIFGPSGTNTVASDQWGTLAVATNGENAQSETDPNPGGGFCPQASNTPGIPVPSGWQRTSPMAALPFPIIADPATSLDTLLVPFAGNWGHLDGLGNWVSHRDPQDTRVTNQYKNGGSGGFYPNGVSYAGVCWSGVNPACSPVQAPLPTVQANWTDTPVTNFPLQVESLHDGIPDSWKQQYGLSTTDTTLYKTTDQTTGLPYIEDYYDGLVPNAVAPYITEPFNGALQNPNIWFSDPCPTGVSNCSAPQVPFLFGPIFTFQPDGNGNQDLQIFNCASTNINTLCQNSSSSFGPQNAVTTNTAVHAGYTCGTGTNPRPNCVTVGDGNGMHDETWYRFHFRFPAGYTPTPGDQNAIMELHVDDKTTADAAAHGGIQAYSTALEVISGGSCPGSPAFCTTTGTNPALYLQVPGGATSCGTACRVIAYQGASNSLQINHWYDIVLHMVWDANPAVGLAELWIDGTQVLSNHMATHYTRSDGTQSYGENFGFFNYPHWANYTVTDQFENVVWGPTRGSINF